MPRATTPVDGEEGEGESRLEGEEEGEEGEVMNGEGDAKRIVDSIIDSILSVVVGSGTFFMIF